MSRLFITPREQQFISDITKEFIKDVVGQYIIYYPVSTLKTKIHPVYEEAIEKIFDNPVKLDVLAGQPQRSTNWNNFGSESESVLEILVQAKDLIDKGFEPTAGDFFVYGNDVYEIVNLTNTENIYGQAEYDLAIKIGGKLSRSGQFNIEDFKQMLDQTKNFASGQVQKKFVQQRGLTENEEGTTNDKREIRERLGEDMADIALGEGPRKVDVEKNNEIGNPRSESESPKSSTFYDE
jgi:hypothetical protein